ncbi:hypothetical protein ACROYT_G023152 [Oculina patagonica]
MNRLFCFSRGSGKNILPTRKQPHECNQCGKRYNCPRDLKQHIRTHTGERPFGCDECDKCFYSASDLKRHKITHTGEKRFKCNQCGKCLNSRAGNLKQHERTHTGEKPFQCNQFYNGKKVLKKDKATCTTGETCGIEQHENAFSIAELLSEMKEIKQEKP